MFQDIDGFYDNHWRPLSPSPDDLALAFRSDGILLNLNAQGWRQLPTVAEIGDDPEDMTYLFAIGERRFFLILAEAPAAPEGFSYEPLALMRDLRPKDLSFACSIAHQLFLWYGDNRFCGHCGERTVLDTKERMIRCRHCGNLIYPKICPGVIVGIIDGDRLLMTRYQGRPSNAFALVAGFTEIGEPIEDTVRREVMEEVGLRVRSITFYKSQPWPLSSSLLCGFFCELDGSPEIHVDHDELAEADWYGADEVPDETCAYSLTREMMHCFVSNRDHLGRLLGRDDS